MAGYTTSSESNETIGWNTGSVQLVDLASRFKIKSFMSVLMDSISHKPQISNDKDTVQFMFTVSSEIFFPMDMLTIFRREAVYSGEEKRFVR